MSIPETIKVGWIGQKWAVHAFFDETVEVVPMCRPYPDLIVTIYQGSGQLRDLTCRNCIRIFSGCGDWSAVDGAAKKARETQVADVDSYFINSASEIRFQRQNPSGRKMPVPFQ